MQPIGCELDALTDSLVGRDSGKRFLRAAYHTTRGPKRAALKDDTFGARTAEKRIAELMRLLRFPDVAGASGPGGQVVRFALAHGFL